MNFDLIALKFLCVMLTIAVCLEAFMLVRADQRIGRLERATFPKVETR